VTITLGIPPRAVHRTPHRRSSARATRCAVAVLVAVLAGCSSTPRHVGDTGLDTSPISASTQSPTITHSATVGPPTRVVQPSGLASPSEAKALPAGVLASIPVAGTGPNPIITAYGSVWVGSHRAQTLERIDPSTNRVIATIDIGQDACLPMVALNGEIMIAFCDDSTREVVVNAKTNQVVGSIASAGVFGLEGGDVWAASPDATRLERLDPSNYRVLATVAAPGEEGTVGGGFVWVADKPFDSEAYAGRIEKVDPKTNRVVATLRTPATGLYMYMVYIDGIIWMKGVGDTFAVKVDTVTGKSTKVAVPGPYDLSSLEDDPVVSGFGSVWIRTGTAVVTRLDARTGRVTGHFPADPAGNGGSPAVGFGSLWIANFDDNTVWRDRVPA
jgi:streptogramin lyase